MSSASFRNFIRSVRLSSGIVAILLFAPGLIDLYAQNSTQQTGTGNNSLCVDPALGCQAQSSSNASQMMPSQGGLLPDSPRAQRPADSSQVYVDSAGNQWQRTVPGNDPNARQVFSPDPITDFQKLARSSTGEALTVFGRDMFQRAPSTFAPTADVPVTPDYVLGPGDEVLVRLFGGESATSNSRLTVDSAGNIYIPRVGTVHVAGLRMKDLQDRIGMEVNRVFRNYQISVSLGQLRSIQVYVVGEARRPGAYTISGLSTVLNALFTSGGPSVQGSMRRIQVRRGNSVIADFDLYDVVLRGDKSHDVRLESGDTIFIPTVGPQVAIGGSVRHPAIYELREPAQGQLPTTTLNDLLSLAGGFSATASHDQIRLERIDADQRRHAISVTLDAAAQAMQLQDGDVLYANHISLGYERSVTIRGNLANPGRFAWKPGMRLSDIIPDQASLLTRDYWRERNQLGVPVPLFEPYEFSQQPGSNSVQSSNLSRGDNNGSNGSTSQLSQSTYDASSSLQPDTRDDLDQQVSLAASGVVANSTAAADQAARSNAAQVLFGNAAGNSSSVAQEGNGNPATPSNNSTAYGNGPQIPQRVPSNINRVRISAPEIDWSYAVVERLDPKTLKSSLIPFHLGRLVQDHDPAQNLELQPGDTVTILNQRDILVPQAEQTKFIRLEGEFTSAGIYSAMPGETLEQLVRRAGGLTPNAYLYGSSFQRESARAFQQQRLDEYITRLSTEMERATAVRGASTASGVSDPNALVLERNIIAQLRDLRATGRVVLEFTPQSIGTDAVPQLALENGDIFRVPSRPNTVSVVGAVYGQNVFLYNPARRLEDYLTLAGRPNRVADKDHAFIIRADGSIFSRELAKGAFSNHFQTLAINPGDAIVIPEKPIKPTGLRQLLDYSQVLSSFGLAAAAINVVR